MLVIPVQAYRADRQSRLSLASSSRTCNSSGINEVKLQAALAALSQVLCSYKKRTHARQHRLVLRVTRKKVPSPVVAFAKLKAAQR